MPQLAPPPRVGALLRDWRRRRRLSQLELALEAGVSARHLSFVETGRSRPSAEMVLHLAEQLDVPLRDRNQLLLAAGYAPRYGERALDDPAMAPVADALQRILDGHDPYPALVADRGWNVVAGNDALSLLTAGVARHLLAPAPNAMRLALHPEALAPRIVNYAQWRAHLLERLERQLVATGDERLAALRDEVTAYPAPDGARAGGDASATREDRARGAGDHDAAATDLAEQLAVPLRLRTPDGGELTFISTVATFGTAVDITVAELSIESFFPADAATAAWVRAHAPV
jgi:transcriptional regulator with XRE-family HTH domain